MNADVDRLRAWFVAREIERMEPHACFAVPLHADHLGDVRGGVPADDAVSSVLWNCE